MASSCHGVEPLPPTGINRSGLHQCIHRQERVPAETLSVGILVEAAAAGHQALQPSASQADGHQISQTNTESETVAVAKRATVSTGLQPDVNNGNRLFGKHAAR